MVVAMDYFWVDREELGRWCVDGGADRGRIESGFFALKPPGISGRFEVQLNYDLMQKTAYMRHFRGVDICFFLSFIAIVTS